MNPMSIISSAKEIADLIKKLGDVELYRKIVELEGEIVEISRQKRTLEEQNEELKRSLKISKQLVFKKPFYYINGDPVPFCPKCWEVDKVAVHMIGSTQYQGNTTYWDCPNCHTGAWMR